MICFHKYPLPLWLKTHRLHERFKSETFLRCLQQSVGWFLSEGRIEWSPFFPAGIWFPGENYSQTLNVQYLKGGVNDFHCPFAGALIQARGPTSQTVRPDYFIMNYDRDENHQSKIISEWNANLMCYTKVEQHWLYPTLNPWFLSVVIVSSSTGQSDS